LDLYTKVDADATAPAVHATSTSYSPDDAKIETINDANSGDLMVRVTKNGETKAVLLTAMDMVEHQGSGLTEQQVIDRVAKTLIADLDREANEMPF